MLYDRDNFKAPSVLPRAAGLVQADYDATPEHIEETGLVKLLTKPIDINVPDSRDLEWIAERKRLDAEGKHQVLPLGRKQLTFKKKVILSDQFAQGIKHAHDLTERVKLIESAIQSGISKTTAGMKQIGEQIAKVLVQNSVSATLNSSELNSVYDQIATLQIDTDYQKAGLQRRFWSYSQYKDQKATLILFLLNFEMRRLVDEGKKKFPEPNKPIWKFKLKSNGKLTREKYVDVSFFNTHMLNSEPYNPADKKTVPKTKPQFYIDLKLGGLVPLSYAIRKAREGWDNKELNGFMVPGKPKESKAQDVLPVGIYNPVWANNNEIKLSDKKQQEMGVNINPNAGIDNKLIPDRLLLALYYRLLL